MCFQALKTLSSLIYALSSTQPPTVVLQKLGVTMNDIWKLSFQFYGICSVTMVKNGKKNMVPLYFSLLPSLVVWDSMFSGSVLCLLLTFVLFPFFIYVFITCEFSQQPLVWNYWSWGSSLLGVQSQCYRTLMHKQTGWQTQTITSVLPSPPAEGRCEESSLRSRLGYLLRYKFNI